MKHGWSLLNVCIPDPYTNFVMAVHFSRSIGADYAYSVAQ